MPIVTIQVTREGTAPGADRTTPEQKAALHKGVSDLLYEVLGKDPDDTFVIFQEVELEGLGTRRPGSPSLSRCYRPQLEVTQSRSTGLNGDDEFERNRRLCDFR